MDEQNPKLRRDWRSFGKEYVIVVLGVATALAAQQAAEWWNWRGQVQQAREFLASELAQNISNSISRLRTEQCTERRLDELTLILEKAASTGSLPPVGVIGMPPQRGTPHNTWDSVVASQAATHFPREQLNRISVTYSGIKFMEPLYAEEYDAWTDLATISGPGGRLDAASLTALRKAVSRARSDNRFLGILAIRLLQRVDTMNLPFSQQDRNLINASRTRAMVDGKYSIQNIVPTFEICAPMGAALPHYGSGQFAGVPAALGDIDKYLSSVLKAVP